MNYLLTNLGIYIALCVIVIPLYLLYLVIQDRVYAFRHRNDPFPEPWTPDDEDES